MSPVGQTGQVYSRMRWPADSMGSAPQPVLDAYTAHEKAADLAEASRAVARAATVAVDRSRQDDAAAALLATQEGRPLPESVREAREADAQVARRQADAHATLAVRAENVLLRTSQEHREEWQALVTPHLEAAVESTSALITDAEKALSEVESLAALYRWLDRPRMDRPPSGGEDARQALRETRALLRDATPLAIRSAIEARQAEEAALAEEISQSVGGVVTRRRVPAAR